MWRHLAFFQPKFVQWTFPTLILEEPIVSFGDIRIKMMIMSNQQYTFWPDYKDVQACLAGPISGGCGAQKSSEVYYWCTLTYK